MANGFTLWAITVYLARNGKPYVISLIPALFMTTVCSTFLFVSPHGFNALLSTLGLSAIPLTVGYALGFVSLAVAIIWFCLWLTADRKAISN